MPIRPLFIRAITYISQDPSPQWHDISPAYPTLIGMGKHMRMVTPSRLQDWLCNIQQPHSSLCQHTPRHRASIHDRTYFKSIQSTCYAITNSTVACQPLAVRAHEVSESSKLLCDRFEARTGRRQPAFGHHLKSCKQRIDFWLREPKVGSHTMQAVRGACMTDYRTVGRCSLIIRAPTSFY